MKRSLFIGHESLVRRATLLRLTARTLAESMRGGGFKSLYKGQGITFDGVREYLPGDDVRSIDWNVTARMDKPFVKQFEEEKELPVFLVVDCSLSMDTGGGGCSRLQTACETGALLTLAAELNSSPVGAVFFDGSILYSVSPKRGFEQTMALLKRFDTIPARKERGSFLGKALTGTGKLLRQRSLVFILSDFRCTGWEQPFALLASKHDVVAICITDEQDKALPDCGTVSFYDVESEKGVLLPTSVDDFKTAWSTTYRKRIDAWKKLCRRRAGFPVVLSTSDSIDQTLAAFFSQRERV
ncbi:MAG: DUF58 domain-containing protein [Treponema sp.]|nr:DUF58 domain-containing protein [Treponema sp.]